MEFSYAFVSPEELYLSEGDAAAASVFEVWCDAYGCTGPFGANVYSWDYTNPLIAPMITNENVANFVAVDGGETGFSANIGHDRWGWDGLNCYWLMFSYDNTQGTVRVLEMDSISPARGVVTDTVAITITGKQFVTGASLIIEGDPGVTASNVTVSSSTTITANLAIAANAAGGNRTIKVRSNNRTSNGKSFFVQIPTRLRRDRLDDLVDIDPGPGNVVNPFNETVATNRCGAYRNVVYTLVDQQQQAQPILPEATITEVLTNFQGTQGLTQPTPKTTTTDEGVIGDTQGITGAHPTCPPPFSYTLNQGFTAKLGQTTFNLTTVNAIAVSKDGSGNYSITITITTQ
jgi:hypothetical protein